MNARTDNRFAMTSGLVDIRNMPLERAGKTNIAPVRGNGAKVLLLSHVFLILLFALVAWSPLLLAQNLFD